MKRNLTCIECPRGCSIDVEYEGEKIISVTGNTCPRGKTYAENEVICPKRVLTTTVRLANGAMLPVKTSEPVRKERLFEIMQQINALHPVPPVSIGAVLIEGVDGAANVVATSNAE